jgi:signal transduction histidine kinase
VAAPSIIISLALLVVGGLGGWYLLSVQKSTATLVAVDLATMRAAEQLVLSVTELRSQLADFLATEDRADLEAIPAKCAQIEESLRNTENIVDDDEEKALARRIRDGFGRLQAESQELLKAPVDSHTRRAVERLDRDLAVRGLLAPARDLLAREEDLTRKSGDYNLGLANRIVTVLCFLAVCGAAAGVIAGVGIARSVSRSIVELYLPVRAASGKLEEVVGPVDIPRSTGIENLDLLLHRMAEQVGTVVDRLQQSQLEVLRGEQMAALGHLAAGLAHELRNPLTAMKVLIQRGARAAKAGKGDWSNLPERPATRARSASQGILPGGAGGREARSPLAPADGLTDRDLAVLETETVRLERSIQTFLDFARPPTLEKRSGDVCQVLEQTLELVRARADQQHVQVARDLSGPLVIEADQEQLRQLFLNLLLNALDTLPQGGAIRVSAARYGGAGKSGGAHLPEQPEGCQWITITVADDGPGVPKDLGDRIFEPYVSTKDTGVGLGLAICRRIVEAHGGRITASNPAAGGALFTIRLPSEKGVSCPAC